MLACFVFPEEVTEFLVKDMHNAGINGEGISVLQVKLALRVCSGKLCVRTAGEAVGWCERSWRMKNKEVPLSPIPHLCDMGVMIVYLHPCCCLQIRLFLHSASWS